MSDFANLSDAGRQLAPQLALALSDAPDAILLAALPNGVPVSLGISETLPLPVQALPVHRSDDGALVDAMPGLEGRTVVVVDDGVETGSVARAAAAAMRASDVGRLVLAVPVCPRDALTDLHRRYDLAVALVKPFGRRSLSWHYDDFDVIDVGEARRLLAEAAS